MRTSSRQQCVNGNGANNHPTLERVTGHPFVASLTLMVVIGRNVVSTRKCARRLKYRERAAVPDRRAWTREGIPDNVQVARLLRAAVGQLGH